MIKKLHTCTKIFFPNPYVVRVDHEEAVASHLALLPKSFTDLRSRAYKLIQGTWGFSKPNFEMIVDPQDFSIATIAVLFSSPVSVMRSYWYIQNEIDALQFRLMVSEKAIQVRVWPETVRFTIHEVIESNES